MSSFVSSRYFLIGALFGLVCLFSILSGTDYLAYYLPAAEYLYHFHAFPAALLPSRIDAPFAYPPAEYFLLAGTFLLGGLQVAAIKLLAAAKCLLLCYLVYVLSRHSVHKELLPAFLFLPTLVMYSFIYNTDINIVLGVAAAVLYFQDRKYRWPAVVLVAYALLCKYTFLPIYLMIFVYFFVFRRRDSWFLLLPLFLYVPFLAKNLTLYGNPVFPLFYDLFNRGAPQYRDLIDAWTSPPLDLRFWRGILRCLTGGLVLTIFFVDIRKYWLLTSFLVLYVLVWLLKMNPNMSGDSIRFVLPASLIIVFMISSDRTLNVSRVKVAMVVQLALFIGLNRDMQTSVYALLAIFYILCAGGRWSRHAVLAVVLLVSGLRMAKKASIDLEDSGYSAYGEELLLLREAVAQDRTLFSDFIIVPLRLREEKNIIIDQSVLIHRRYLDQVYQADLVDTPDYLLVEEATLEHYRFARERYEAVKKVRQRTLFRKRTGNAP